MSVRVCYVRRGDRGASLRSLRLVGQASDESWPAEGEAPGAADDFALAARFVKERLELTRTATGLSMLCLDADGAACTWMSCPTTDPTVVASAARLGSEAGKAGGGAFEFYASGNEESTIQALSDEEPGRRRRGEPAAPPRRLPVLAVSDVAARVFMDALDRENVPVESVATIWHSLALAWDPAAGSDDNQHVLTACVVVDPAGRLVWSWSRNGHLVAGGTLRLRVARLEAAGGPDSDETAPRFGEAEASRLTAEWLSWSVQVSAAPSRVVCVLTPGEDAGGFGSALSAKWPGAAVDAVTDDDPIGATLRRVADRLEATPRSRVRATAPTTGLVDLSRRPGKVNRRMLLWQSAAVLALAGVLFAASWRLYALAEQADKARTTLNAQWRAKVGEVYPDALVPRPNVSPVKFLSDEVAARRKNLLPPDRSDQTMPILQELETVTLVIGTGNFSLESIDLRTVGAAHVIVVAKDIPSAESLQEAFNRVGGSYVTSWTGRFSEKMEGSEKRIRADYSGDWNRDALKGGQR